MEKYRWSEEIFDDLRSNIIAALDLSREQNDEEVCRFIEKEVEEYSRKNLLTLKEREQLEHLLFNSLRKYDAIQELLEDPEVTEIMINGASRIFYEKKGKLFRAQTHFSSEQKLGDVIRIVEEGNSNIFPFAQSNVLSSDAASFDSFRTIKKNYSMLVRFEIIE